MPIACLHTHGGMSEEGCAPFRSWKIFVFCNWNHAICLILLGANLEQAMNKDTQFFGPG